MAFEVGKTYKDASGELYKVQRMHSMGTPVMERVRDGLTLLLAETDPGLGGTIRLDLAWVNYPYLNLVRWYKGWLILNGDNGGHLLYPPSDGFDSAEVIGDYDHIRSEHTCQKETRSLAEAVDYINRYGGKCNG